MSLYVSCTADLSNGAQDSAYANGNLLEAYRVAMEVIRDDYTSRDIVLSTNSSDGITPMEFEEVSKHFYDCN